MRHASALGLTMALLLLCSKSNAMFTWQVQEEDGCIETVRAWTVDAPGQHMGDRDSSKTSQALSGNLHDIEDPPDRAAEMNLVVSITVKSQTVHGQTQAYRLWVFLKESQNGNILDYGMLTSPLLGDATYTFSAMNLLCLGVSEDLRVFNWINIHVQALECNHTADCSRIAVFTEADFLRPVNLTLTPSTLDALDESCTGSLTHDPMQWQGQTFLFIWPYFDNSNISGTPPNGTGPGTEGDPRVVRIHYLDWVGTEMTQNVTGVVTDAAGSSRDAAPLTLVPEP